MRHHHDPHPTPGPPPAPAPPQAPASDSAARAVGTRQLVHTRRLVFQVWARDDGLWDVEGSLSDTKEVPLQRPGMATLQPGDVVHGMSVCLTFDDDLRVVGATARMEATPFGECTAAGEPLRRLIGTQIGRGWRRAIDEAMGGTAGCTHLRELTAALATAAIQGIPSYRDQRRQEQGIAPLPPQGGIPHYVGGCLTWRRDGPVVRRLLPEFAVDPVADTDVGGKADGPAS